MRHCCLQQAASNTATTLRPCDSPEKKPDSASYLARSHKFREIKANTSDAMHAASLHKCLGTGVHERFAHAAPQCDPASMQSGGVIHKDSMAKFHCAWISGLFAGPERLNVQ